MSEWLPLDGPAAGDGGHVPAEPQRPRHGRARARADDDADHDHQERHDAHAEYHDVHWKYWAICSPIYSAQVHVM